MLGPQLSLGLALLTIATLGCAGRAPDTGPPLQLGSKVSVSIDNQNMADADIYAVRVGQRYRVGWAIAHSSTTVQVPVSMLEDGDLRLYVHLIGGGGDYVTDVVHVDAEGEPCLQLMPAVNMSSFYVRPR